MSGTVLWNNKLRLVVSVVDETIADVYTPAEPEMIAELNRLLSEGVRLFMVSGGSLRRVTSGITEAIAPELRRNILISHCSGAEVWGFTAEGELRETPFYSLYAASFSDDMKLAWREAVDKLVAEFGFRLHPVEPKLSFRQKYSDPLDIMYDDRGPQITLELVNATDLTDAQVARLSHDVPLTHGARDLRIPVLERAEQIFADSRVPITPRLGGMFAVDFALAGVSKATSMRRVLEDTEILATIGLTQTDLAMPEAYEIWGDKFSSIRGGTDRHMCEALDPLVRAIDFRAEDPAEFLDGYNIVLWDGTQHLHRGLLEYLKTR